MNDSKQMKARYLSPALCDLKLLDIKQAVVLI